MTILFYFLKFIYLLRFVLFVWITLKSELILWIAKIHQETPFWFCFWPQNLQWSTGHITQQQNDQKAQFSQAEPYNGESL